MILNENACPFLLLILIVQFVVLLAAAVRQCSGLSDTT
jgi:hypothetical protein